MKTSLCRVAPLETLGEPISFHAGLGSDGTGVYLFFFYFGVAMSLLIFLILLASLWASGHVPKIVLVRFTTSHHLIRVWSPVQSLAPTVDLNVDSLESLDVASMTSHSDSQTLD